MICVRWISTIRCEWLLWCRCADSNLDLCLCRHLAVFCRHLDNSPIDWIQLMYIHDLARLFTHDLCLFVEIIRLGINDRFDVVTLILIEFEGLSWRHLAVFYKYLDWQCCIHKLPFNGIQLIHGLVVDVWSVFIRWNYSFRSEWLNWCRCNHSISHLQFYRLVM